MSNKNHNEYKRSLSFKKVSEEVVVSFTIIVVILKSVESVYLLVFLIEFSGSIPGIEINLYRMSSLALALL